MHKLWQHPNGRWYVLYGPRLRRQISAQTKDRGEAEKFLARFIAVSGEPDKAIPTVGAILSAYEVDRAGVRAPNSLKFGVKALQPLRDLFPSQLTPTAVRNWAKERGASAGTILRDVGVLRAAMAWAVEHQWIGAAPIISNPVKTPRGRKRWLSRDEAKALLGACRDPHIKVFINLGLHTLARSGAILDARWDHIDWKRKLIDYGEGHGNKHRAIIPLNDEVLKVLKAAHALSCSDHIVEFRGDRVHTVKNGFEAARARAGLGDDVTPHVLRHSGASWLIEAGVPEDEVARMLGDTVEMVRKVYGHFSPDYLRRASNALKLESKPGQAP